MTEMPDWCWVASSLTFRGPAEKEFPASEVQIRWERESEDAPVREVRVSFQVDLATWQAIDAAQAFHLAPDARGPSFVESFDAAKPVEIEARLDPAHLGRFAAAEDIFDAAAEVLEDEDGGPLQQTESYYALNVKQEIHPQVKAGFATRWLNEGG